MIKIATFGATFGLTFATLLPLNAFAFKWDKCKQEYKHQQSGDSKAKTVGGMIANYLADFTSQATIHTSTSTTSFVSSTGNCAAFAKADEERKLFIAESSVEIKMESALGHGEHIASLAYLYGCGKNVEGKFIEMVKTNHSKIFRGPASEEPSALNDRIINTLMSVDELKSACDLQRI